jgi:hypothetical protein
MWIHKISVPTAANRDCRKPQNTHSGCDSWYSHGDINIMVFWVIVLCSLVFIHSEHLGSCFLQNFDNSSMKLHNVTVQKTLNLITRVYKIIVLWMHANEHFTGWQYYIRTWLLMVLLEHWTAYKARNKCGKPRWNRKSMSNIMLK